MSGLRYQTDSGDVVSGDAAQNFLKNKLSKGIAGKYTQEQVDRLAESGGPAVVNASDGAVPGGPAYPTQYKEGTGSFTANPYDYSTDKWAHGSGDVSFTDDWSDSYAQQIKAGGALDDSYVKQFESLAKGDSSIDDDGEWRTLKSQKNSEATTTEDFKKLAKEWKAAGFDVRVQDLDNSRGAEWADIAVRKGPGGKNTGGEEIIDPIEHSPEMKQATERVRSYENDVNSGKMSDDIFGGMKDVAGSQYAFDSNKGATGIGTSGGVANDNSSSKATANFLDAKKTDVKKAYNFKPASN